MKIKHFLLATSISVLAMNSYAACPALTAEQLKAVCHSNNHYVDFEDLRIHQDGVCPSDAAFGGSVGIESASPHEMGGQKCIYRLYKTKDVIRTHVLPVSEELHKGDNSQSGGVQTPPPPPPPPPPVPSMSDTSTNKKGWLRSSEGVNTQTMGQKQPVAPKKPEGMGNIAQQALNVKLKKSTPEIMPPKTQQPSPGFDLRSGLKQTTKGVVPGGTGVPPQEMPRQNITPPSSMKLNMGVSNSVSNIPQKLPPVKKLTVEEIKKLEAEKDLILKSMMEERKKLTEINKKLNENR